MTIFAVAAAVGVYAVVVVVIVVTLNYCCWLIHYALP